jgi:hypothetical protein
MQRGGRDGTLGSRFQVRYTPHLGRARGTPGAGEQLLVDLGLRSPRTNTTALFGELNARSIEMSVSEPEGGQAGRGLGAGKGTVVRARGHVFDGIDTGK